MASLKECRARAKKLGLRLTVLPKTDYWYKREGDRYKLSSPRNAFGTKLYFKAVASMSKELSALERGQKRAEMMRKLNGHRLKYGYKTVPRKPRKKR